MTGRAQISREYSVTALSLEKYANSGEIEYSLSRPCLRTLILT